MVILIMILVLSGLIEHVLAIQCYTCSQAHFHCPLPLNLDGGDESNENDIDTSNYDPGYACVSDHSLNPRTGEEKIILRGIKHCREIDIPNHRVHCCHTDNCNKQLPSMTIRIAADTIQEGKFIPSTSQHSIFSIFLIVFSIIFQYFFIEI